MWGSVANRWQATTGPCNASRTSDWLWCSTWEFLDNHPSSPDLEPSRLNPFKFTYNTSVLFVFTFYKKITYRSICPMSESFTLTLYCRQIRSMLQLMFSIFLPSFGVLVRRPFVFLKLGRLLWEKILPFEAMKPIAYSWWVDYKYAHSFQTQTGGMASNS
jgi:hypothetical protein